MHEFEPGDIVRPKGKRSLVVISTRSIAFWIAAGGGAAAVARYDHTLAGATLLCNVSDLIEVSEP